MVWIQFSSITIKRHFYSQLEDFQPCYQLQAVTDWVGRSVATFTQWPGSSHHDHAILAILASLRWAFLPLIMACNVLPSKHRLLTNCVTLPTGERSSLVLFQQDWEFCLIFSLFNIIGGYLSNKAFMLGPKKVFSILSWIISNPV